MKIQPIDITIICFFLAITFVLGFIISGKAHRNLDSYFLGGKKFPWYILGISNAASMFDITGTMWFVAAFFIYGIKSAWLPWFWPIWNQIFLMMFLSQWLRRSNSMTGAEWLKTRFGDGKGGILSHIMIVSFAVISVIGFIAYCFEGIGKFASSFLPWDLTMIIGTHTISSESIYAFIIIAFISIYVVKGGMYSVVLTQVLQYIILIISCIIIAIISFWTVTPEQLNAVVPNGWDNLFFGWKLNLDWSHLIPAVNDKIAADGYQFFAFFMMMIVFKGILESIAGPVPSYDLQRILATRSPKEAAKMSGLVSIILFIPRYLMVAGVAVLALVYFSPKLNAMGKNIDFEMILPYAVSNFIPVGLMGLLLAGLISAFISNFAAYVNAGPAYIVNDVYKRFINPNASDKKYIRISYLVSAIFVIIGIICGSFITSIDAITKWIVAALFGGYMAPNFLKWIWWRFNGYGYFWGMLTGLLSSLLILVLFPSIPSLNMFPFILILSGVGSVAGSLLTQPDDMNVLKKFYTSVRPWGFWNPVYLEVIKDNPDFRKNENFWHDMLNCLLGTIWQLSMILIAMFFIIRKYEFLAIASTICILMMIILKRTWYNKLEDN